MTKDTAALASLNSKIASRIKTALDKKVFPGCCFGLIDSSGYKSIMPFGSKRYECKDPIFETSIFDSASLTKVIPTASLALLLIQKGILNLSSKIASIIPECNGRYQDLCTVAHLLTHTIDWDIRLSELRTQAPDRILNRLYNAPLAAKPGTRFSYSNASSVILGLLIERIAQRSLDSLAQEYLFDPLGMNDTTFFTARLDTRRIVPTEIESFRNREVCGEVHDESAWALRPIMVAGSAGLFSTVPDILKFIATVITQSPKNEASLFTAETKRQMHNNQIGALGNAGLGWELCQKAFMGEKASLQTIGKTGFTGCSMVCDMSRGVGFVVLSNSTYPKRPHDKSGIMQLRRDIADIVWEYYA